MAARRKRKGSTKVPFALKDRKKMVQDLEEVQYDDVVQMAIQRLEAGLHLERYKSRREFVSIIRIQSLRAPRTGVLTVAPGASAR